MELSIAPLGKQHERNAFDCVEPSLNQYLYRYASQDIWRRINRVIVASPHDAPHKVIGYYRISAGGLAATDLPEKIRRR